MTEWTDYIGIPPPGTVCESRHAKGDQWLPAVILDNIFACIQFPLSNWVVCEAKTRVYRPFRSERDRWIDRTYQLTQHNGIVLSEQALQHILGMVYDAMIAKDKSDPT